MPPIRKKSGNPLPLIIFICLFLMASLFAGFLFLQNSMIKKSNAALKDDIADINKTISDIQKEDTALKEKISSFEKETAGLQSEKDKLTAANSELNDKLKALTDEYAALKKDYDKLLIDYNNLNKNNVLSEQYVKDNDDVKIAYLTFDDGISKNTNKILDILKKYKIKATFFPNWKSGNDEIYKRIVEEGHALGNHTYDHVWEKVYTSIEGFKSEVTKLQEKIKQATGGYTPVLFRFPGGSNNTVSNKYNKAILPQAIKAIHDMGMEYFDWNVDSADSSSVKPLAADKIVSNVITGSRRNRVIILMHDTSVKPTTVDALPKIIEELKEKGYIFDKLSKDVVPIQFKKS